MSPRTTEQLKKLKEDRRQTILDAALHVFSEETYHAASISKIAKKAGISKGLMYNYFENKEALLNTLILEIADKFIERIVIPENGMLTDEDVMQFVDISFEMILEDLPFAKLFFSLYTQQDVMALMTDKMLERVVPYMTVMYTYFEQKGHEDPAAVMRYFSATIDGVQMHLLMDPSFPLESVKKLIIKQFINA